MIAAGVEVRLSVQSPEARVRLDIERPRAKVIIVQLPRWHRST